MDRLHAYENVNHVLETLADVHHHINRAINQLRGNARDDRRKLALGFLADQQSRRAGVLAAYRRDADPTLLKQWFQIPFPENTDRLLDSIHSKDPDSTPIDELIHEIDGFMGRLLQHMRNRAETGNLRALFADLLDIEERERHLRSRALSSFDQV